MTIDPGDRTDFYSRSGSPEKSRPAGRPDGVRSPASALRPQDRKTPLTRLRQLVLECLTEAAEPIKAYDLLEMLRRKGTRMTPSSAYRILDFLETSGLIHRVNALNAYLACNAGPSQAHQPLIVVCSGCQKTVELNDQKLCQSIFQRL
ncbi:MAG: transcriptional repressor, partial [Deltaproteobacteria bacterium]|nr:transcriptional repressor [Deltaproteobacteria bacterium]